MKHCLVQGFRERLICVRMVETMNEQKEKKVEYVELVYDLIFVYMVGRNNSLLHHVDGGFVHAPSFLAYILCTLAIIQVWNFTTFYVNMFGRNGVREHVFLFINMYLLYFVGESTRADYINYMTQYHVAWGLILVNIGIQYLLELRNHEADVWNRDIMKRMSATLFVEAAIVFLAAISVPAVSTALSAVAIVTGITLTAVSRNKSLGGSTDFMHLSERAMLYVVFTFGEMIIALAGYFEGNGQWQWNTIYFSMMAFLIVVGLFLSYEVFYDHLINREGEYDGMLYLAIHILILFALNNITVSLEFMREAEVEVLPKMVFLVLSIVGYFVFLFALKGYVKQACEKDWHFWLRLLLLTLAFILCMLMFRNYMDLNIFLTVLYVFSIYSVLRRAKTKE